MDQQGSREGTSRWTSLMGARPSPSMVVALIALAVALSGSAVAVTATDSKKLKLPKNSVGSKQIKPGAVKKSDLADNAVVAGKIAPGAVSSSELAPDSVGAPAVRSGLLSAAKFDGSVTGDTILDGAITSGDLVSDLFPAVSVTTSSSTPIPDGVGAFSTTLSFDTELYDTGKMHAASSPTRLVAPATGLYEVSAIVDWGPSPNTEKYWYIYGTKNGASQFAFDGHGSTAPDPPGTKPTHTFIEQVSLTKGDFVELSVYHECDCGGEVSVDVVQSSLGTTTSTRPVFTMRQVSP